MYGANYQYGTSPSHQAQNNGGQYGGGMGGGGVMMDTNPSHRQMLGSPQFTPQQPPPRTNMQGIHPNAAQYAGAVAYALFNASMNNAGQNAAFMYYYNVNAAQNYQGDNWLRSVEFAVMLLWSFMERGAGNIDNQINEAVNTTVIMKASALAAGNNMVLNAVDQGTRADIMGYAQEHERLRGVFGAMLQQFANQVHAAQNPQQAYGGVVGAALSNNMNPGLQPTANLYNHGQASGAPAGVYGGGAVGLAAAPGSSAKNGALYSFDDPIPEGNHTPESLGTVTELGATNQEPQQIDAPVYTAESRWTPTVDQPYKPLPFGGDSKVVYESITNAAGQEVVLAMVEAKDEEDMNRDEYKIPVLNSMMQEAVEKRHGGDPQKIIRNMDLIAKGITATEVREEPEVIRLFAEANLVADGEITDSEEVVYGLEHAVVQAAQSRLYAPTDTIPLIFNYKATLVTDGVVSKTDMSAILERLGESGTYAVAASLLHQYIEENKDDAEALLVLKKIDEYAAKVFTYYLQVGCGLQGWAIDSFRTDVMEIVSQAGVIRGNAFATALNKFARDFNWRVFGSLHVDDVVVNDKTVGYRLDLSESVIVSLIDVDSESLRMQFKPGQVLELFETNFPGLQPLLMALSKGNHKKGRCFFVTADGVVFGFDRSIMGEHIAVIYKV